MNLAERFARASTPAQGTLSGEYAVKLILPLGPGIRFFDHKKVITSPSGNAGCNMFLNSFEVGNFVVENGPSDLGDGEAVLKIRYGSEGNPPGLSGLTDECKQESEGLFFCRGIYSLPVGSPFILMYFTMERC